MKISTRGRYALRLMLELASCEKDKPISIKDIASKQQISDKYLEQIISVLNKAGYVKSIRGSQGGYILTNEPKWYTVGMILRLTEGSLAPVACIEVNDCEKSDSCVTKHIWQKINDAVNQVVDNITLEELVNMQNKESSPS